MPEAKSHKAPRPHNETGQNFAGRVRLTAASSELNTIGNIDRRRLLSDELNLQKAENAWTL